MSYEQLPEGTYAGRVIPQSDGNGQASIVFGESTKKGTPYASVKLEITEGEFTGRFTFWTGYMTTKTIVKTVKALHAMGFQGNRLTAFLDQKPNTAIAFGIAHEEYEGKVRAKVVWVGAAIEKLEPAKLDELSDQLAELLEAEESNGQSVLAGPGLGDDDPMPTGPGW